MNIKTDKKMASFFNKNNTACSALSFMLLMACSFSSNGASLTSYRIYLDDENRTESFIIFAKGNAPEKCSLNLKHFDFNDVGNMSVPKSKKVPDNSAAPWIRFSPRHFTVEPSKPQSIRFSMRRKANTVSNEYRSYLSISCKNIENEVKKETVAGRPNVSVKPNLVQNIPIIVRTGPLQATARFDDIKINDGLVEVNLKREGNRSLYGRLSLVNNKTDEELSYTSGVSLYTETTSSQFKFSLKGNNMPATEDIALKFVEDKSYGGSLTIQKNLK